MTSLSIDCDVIVIGGGPVGLFLACELGAYGVATELYEQAATTSVHPKANTHSARSLELYRRHGLSTPFRDAGWPAERPSDIAYRTRLTGHEIGRVGMPSPAAALTEAATDHPRWPTPEPQLRASQRVLEPLLEARARAFEHVRVAFSAEVVGFDDEGGSVVAHVHDGEQIVARRARYLVACDGARSSARGRLEIPFLGEGGLDLRFMGGTMITTYFRAPGLLSVLPGPPAWQYWIINPEFRSLVVSLDGEDDFVLHHQLGPDETLETFDFGRALARVADGLDIPHRVISAAPWRAGRALVAQRYGRGRVALAGDAAHLFTPTGGMGVNTGIEDVANLAWKISGALSGWAGPGLLASYERERRPIAERNSRFALSLARAVSACPVTADLEASTQAGEEARTIARRHIDAVARNEFDHPGIQLGSRYDTAGLVVDPPAATESAIDYRPTMDPGGRLPHVWLAEGKSTLDLCGHHFTLLDFTGRGSGIDAFAARAAARGIPFATFSLDRPDITRRFGAERVLVRPDQIVAWRGGPLSDEAIDTMLDTVTGCHVPGADTFDVGG